jgi:peroxiredoxin
MLQRRPFITHSLALGSAALLPALASRPAHAAAAVGQAAPAFSLPDTAGQAVSLAQFKGKPVVLEWNNPGCPFVRKHYQGNMQALQKDFAQRGVVWLAINSTRDDSPDYLSPPQLARWMREQGASPAATLMDEAGTVGQAYGARVTPHMYIVNAQGLLVYAGGIDSIPSARVADIEKATNHVRQGLTELLAGQPLSVRTSQAYGCSIKYKNAAA